MRLCPAVAVRNIYAGEPLLAPFVFADSQLAEEQTSYVATCFQLLSQGKVDDPAQLQGRILFLDV